MRPALTISFHVTVVIFALLSAGRCAQRPGADPPDIILISIDSLRPQNLGCYGYPRDTSPFLDSLAEGGTRFTDAVSTTSWTLPAHAALFTGLYDTTHGLVDNDTRLGDGHRTLAELLRESGYHTAGFFGGPYLHPTFGVGQGFDLYQSCMTTTADDATADRVRDGARATSGASHGDVTGPRTRTEIDRWAETRPVDRPYFLFVHLWDVHYDYIPPPGYVERFDPDYDGDLTGVGFTTDPRIHARMPERDLRHLIALYDGEIRFTDDILRGIFADLERRGMLSDALVVVTADHGEEFFEHGDKGHQRTLFDEVLKVPLIVHWPRGVEAGRTIDTQVRLIDLMPTLLEFAGFEGPLPIQGRSLVPLLRGRDMPPAPSLGELLVNRQSMRVLRTETSKVLQLEEGGPGVLFDLATDPAETRPILPGPYRNDEREEAERALLRTLAEARSLRDAIGGTVTDAPELDDEMLERLRSLGYVN